MTNLLTIISLWLHALGTAVLVGHYALLVLVYIPAVKASAGEAAGAVLGAISKRSRSWLYAALIIFALTGVYLTLVDAQYLGLGNFSNAWSISMLAKHILILGMLVMGFWYNAILRVGPMLSSKSGAVQAFDRFQAHANLMAITGGLALLLTAISQAQ